MKAKILVNSGYHGTTFGLALPVTEVMKKGSNESSYLDWNLIRTKNNYLVYSTHNQLAAI